MQAVSTANKHRIVKTKSMADEGDVKHALGVLLQMTGSVRHCANTLCTETLRIQDKYILGWI